ncbi:MAG: RHS repeat protein, partial [Thermoleophilaceae bacterium]|nr:RHS repeat protein [Thermoleophilaceae bacterium]
TGDFITRRYEYDRNDNQTLQVDGEGKRWASTYTPMDRIASESTPLDERTAYDYDREEGLTQITAPRGTETPAAGDFTTRFELDAIGRRLATVQQATDADSLITSYAYDRRDNVVGVALPKNNTADGQTVSVSQAISRASTPESQRFAYDFDAANQLVAEVEDPVGETLRSEYVYDQNGNLRITLGPRGFVEGPDPAAFARITDYDERDLPVAETDELGNRSEYERRADGLVVAETRPNGAATALAGDYTIDYDYDANGALESRSLPWREGQYGLSNGELDAQRVVYRRNAVGDPVEVTDARGNAIRNTFYDTGDLESTTRPSWWGLDWGEGTQTPDPGERYPATGGSAAAEPDLIVPQGGPTLSERPRPESGGEPNAAEAGSELVAGASGETDFGDVDPEVLGDMMPAAGTTSFSYDDELRMTEVVPEPIDGRAAPFEIAYDAVGRIASKTWPLDPYAQGQATPAAVRHSFDYDRNGNLRTFTNGQGNLAGENAGAHTTRFSYDQFDRRIAEAAPGSKDVSDPELNKEVTNLAYDPNGNLLRRETPRGSTTPDPDDFSFRFGYDSVDRLLSESNPLRDAWNYSYDAASNRVSETSPRGTETAAGGDFTTTTAYDPANRPIAIDEPEGRVTELEYDRNGNVLRAIEPGAATELDSELQPGSVQEHVTTYSYDGRDLLWKETVGEGDYRRTTITEYDPNGNLRRTVNPIGVSDAGEPAATDDGSDGWANAEHASVNLYDADDQLTATLMPWGTEGDSSDPNGVGQASENSEHWRQDRRYDERGRLIAISSPYEDGAAGERRFTTYTHYDTGWIRSNS